MYQGFQVEVSPRGYIKNPTLESEKTTDVVVLLSIFMFEEDSKVTIVLPALTTVIGC